MRGVGGVCFCCRGAEIWREERERENEGKRETGWRESMADVNLFGSGAFK